MTIAPLATRHRAGAVDLQGLGRQPLGPDTVSFL
jgi:hypothetical protein